MKTLRDLRDFLERHKDLPDNTRLGVSECPDGDYRFYYAESIGTVQSPIWGASKGEDSMNTETEECLLHVAPKTLEAYKRLEEVGLDLFKWVNVDERSEPYRFESFTPEEKARFTEAMHKGFLENGMTPDEVLDLAYAEVKKTVIVIDAY